MSSLRSPLWCVDNNQVSFACVSSHGLARQYMLNPCPPFVRPDMIAGLASILSIIFSIFLVVPIVFSKLFL